MRDKLGLLARIFCLTSVFGLLLTASAVTETALFPGHSLNAQEAAGTIAGFTASVGSDTVGVRTDLVLAFRLEGDSIRPGIRFEVVTPPEFNLTDLDSVRYTDGDTANLDYSVAAYSFAGDLLLVELDTLGTAPEESSLISLIISGSVNPETVGGYRVALAILTAGGEWLATPVWSPYFDIRAASLSQLELYPKGIQSVRAGNVISFFLETADQYGNPVSVPEVTWEVIGAPLVTGTIVDGEFQARKAGASRVAAHAGGLSDTSSLIYVLPGVFAYLSLKGGASAAVAGRPWPDDTADVMVQAHDIFGNVIQDFEGEAYFECTDPQATLPATAANPFQFQIEDEGRHVFKGSEFRFLTAGKHDLRLLHEAEVQQTLASITVEPDQVAAFEVLAPEAALAGDNFTVEIINANDNWGNSVSGLVTLSLSSGSGQSPSGVAPTVAPFLVTEGFGSTEVTLVKAELAELRFAIGSVQLYHEVLVEPAALHEFDFALDNLQVSGQPFFGTAALTALDRFGNIQTPFSAAADPITVTSSGAGAVFNNRVMGGDDFISGICDLTKLGVGYDGDEFFVTFTATSESGKTGESPVVQFAAVKLTDGWLEKDVKYVGEEYELLITITNFGSQSATINQIRVFGGDSELLPSSVYPQLPDTVGAADQQTFRISGPVPDLPGELIALSASFSGHFGAEAVTDSVGNLATLRVLAPTGISVVPQSLAPTQVTVGREYEFSVSIRNESEDALTLQANTSLTLPLSEGAMVSLPLQSPTVVQPDGEPMRLRFTRELLPLTPAGVAGSVSLDLHGTLGSIDYDQSLPVEEEVLLETPPLVTYSAGSLVPVVLYRGRDASFSLEIVNEGTATLSVESGALRLFAGKRSLSGSLAEIITTIGGGSTSLSFDSIFVPVDWPRTVDSLRLDIVGEANGHQELIRLALSGDLITIPSGAAVKIAASAVEAPNAPWVNVGQQYGIVVTVSNEGDEPLEQIQVSLQSDGASEYDSDITIGYLSLDVDTTILFEIVASLQPTISELFRVGIESATGADSRIAAQILPPATHTHVVVIQSPANLSLVAEITEPEEAQDRIVEPETEFTLSAVVLNIGQAEVGRGRLSLSLPEAGFITDSPLVQEFSVGQEISWVISAPAFPDTGNFRIKIDSLPMDLNWQKAAKAVDSEQFLDVAVREVQVGISVDFSAAESPLLKAGDAHDVLDLEFNIIGKAEEPYLKSLEVMLMGRDAAFIEPGGVLSSASILLNEEHDISGLFLNDPYRIRFELGADYGMPERAVLSLTIMESPSVFDFTLYLDSTSFAAGYQAASGEKPVPVTAEFASRLVITQEFTLVPTLLEDAFFCYPNPFSPVGQQLKFTNPRPGKHVSLSIFTLTGEEVITITVGPGAGDLILWDGRNEAGNIVLNGIYIAVLTIEGEGEARTKVAVVK